MNTVRLKDVNVFGNAETKKSCLPFRMNIVFFVVFILFSILILRLGWIQIVQGENYRRDLDRKEDYTVTNPVPRGKMYDRKFRVIVDNVPRKAITFTNEGFSQNEMLETSKKLAELIDQKIDKITDRDMRDFWILKNPERANAKITKKEQALFAGNQLSDKDT